MRFDARNLVDSVADGAIELAEGPVRVADNVAAVAKEFSSQVKTNMDSLKTRLPDDLSAIPDLAMTGVSQTARAGISLVEALGKGVLDTVVAIKNQTRRIS